MAQQRASTGRTGHPVIDSTAACGERLDGGPGHDAGFGPPGPRLETDLGFAVTPHPVAPSSCTRATSRAELIRLA